MSKKSMLQLEKLMLKHNINDADLRNEYADRYSSEYLEECSKEKLIDFIIDEQCYMSMNVLTEKQIIKEYPCKLTEERKATLDSYSQEEINYLWNAFTQEEINYIEGVK